MIRLEKEDGVGNATPIDSGLHASIFLSWWYCLCRLSSCRRLSLRRDNLLNNSHIRRVGEKPMVLKYVEDTKIIDSSYGNLSDVSDVTDADRSDDDGTMNFDCYYCNYRSNIEDEYERHVIIKHPTKPCYPGKADLEKLGLIAKGQSWEI